MRKILLIAVAFSSFACSDSEDEVKKQIDGDKIQTEIQGTWVPYSYSWNVPTRIDLVAKCGTELYNNNKWDEEFLSRIITIEPNKVSSWKYNCDSDQVYESSYEIDEKDGRTTIYFATNTQAHLVEPITYRIVSLTKTDLVLDNDLPWSNIEQHPELYFLITLKRR